MFLDISQSSYIFRQQIIIGIIMMVICAGLLAYLVIRLNKRLAITNSKRQEIGTTTLGILVIIIGYIVFFLPLLTKTLGLKNNGVETIGKTVQWINNGDSRIIEYSFNLNGQTFTKRCEVVYNGHEIKGIICPNGNYIVIYDKDNPDNSVMDFKRAVK